MRAGVGCGDGKNGSTPRPAPFYVQFGIAPGDFFAQFPSDVAIRAFGMRGARARAGRTGAARS